MSTDIHLFSTKAKGKLERPLDIDLDAFQKACLERCREFADENELLISMSAQFVDDITNHIRSGIEGAFWAFNVKDDDDEKESDEIRINMWKMYADILHVGMLACGAEVAIQVGAREDPVTPDTRVLIVDGTMRVEKMPKNVFVVGFLNKQEGALLESWRNGEVA